MSYGDIGPELPPGLVDGYKLTLLMNSHGKIVCSCGALIAQCRCFVEHKGVTVQQDGCDKCKALKNSRDKQSAPALYPAEVDDE